MGRAKLRMELISKEKSRNTTFKKRKEGLIRKLHEFTTLCDVKACMIIYGPKQEKVPIEPEIWPQNMDEINRVIALYKAKNKDSGNKTYCLSDFFHDRKRKIEEELAKLRKKNMESKYPTWLDLLNFMNEAQLRDFAGSLAHKAQYVRSRIEFLRRSKEALGLNLSNFYEQGGASSSVNPLHYPTIDHHYQDLHSVNQNNNSMMMLLMDNNDQIMQFGGASNVQSTASFKRQVFYESMMSGCGVVDYPIMFPGPSQYYVPPSLPLPLPPVPVGVMAQRQMQVCIRENHEGGQEDVVPYEMNQNHQKGKGQC